MEQAGQREQRAAHTLMNMYKKDGEGGKNDEEAGGSGVAGKDKTKGGQGRREKGLLPARLDVTRN